MKFFGKYLATAAILAFTGLAVFGFVAMGDMSHDSGKCLAAKISNVDCSNIAGSLGLAFFHVSAYKQFSQTTITSFILLTLFLFTVFAFLVIPKLEPIGLFNKPSFLPQKRRFTRWLSLHENSPN